MYMTPINWKNKKLANTKITAYLRLAIEKVKQKSFSFNNKDQRLLTPSVYRNHTLPPIELLLSKKTNIWIIF